MRFYIIGLICAIIVGAYFYGRGIGNAKCQIKNLEQTQQTQIQIIKNKGVINDKVFKTGADDIRRILHDKYSIAE